MHEVSLAGGILQVVEQTCARDPFARVTHLRLQAGALAGVEGADHVEVELGDAEPREQRREGGDGRVVGLDHAHVDGEALALARERLAP